MTATYITTTIPYVNARPHIGHALELVQADVLARYRRARGDEVRFQSGTDDNSLKNVLAAEAAGIGVRVRRPQRRGVRRARRRAVADRRRLHPDQPRPPAPARRRAVLAGLRRTCTGSGARVCTAPAASSSTPRPSCGRPLPGTRDGAAAGQRGELVLPAVPLRRAAARGDHLRAAAHRARRAAQRGARVHRRRPGGFLGVAAREQGRRLGIPVPGDPGQVIYVWFDALCNYVTALLRPRRGGLPAVVGRPGNRVHLLGKGVLRFHAVYWRAMPLVSGQPLPTGLFVHGYLTADGRKISKSASGPEAGPPEPAELAAAYGADAVRWWLLREVPRVGDADFTAGRLIARADDEPANGLGNLVNRVVAKYPPLPRRPVARGHCCRVAPRGGQPERAACRDANEAAAPPWRISTSGGRRPRSGGSSTRRTLRQPGPSLGTGPGRAGTAAARHGARRCCGPARCSAGSSRRSCRTWPPASPPSAPRPVTAGCRSPARCSGGCRRVSRRRPGSAWNSRSRISRTMAPMIDPMIPTGWKLWMLSVWCWIRFCRKPPTKEPTMPSTMVPRIPMGSRPGTSSRATAPAMRPMMMSTIMKVPCR